MNLSPHFTLAELTASDTALRLGLDNTPGPQEVENLKRLAAGLEECRALTGHPWHISSGFRSLEVNRKVGSADTSHHRLGLAADGVCPGFGSPKDVCRAIRDSDIQFNQLIYEGTWVHISFAEPVTRRSVLTAKFPTPEERAAGKRTEYLEGIV